MIKNPLVVAGSLQLVAFYDLWEDLSIVHMQEPEGSCVERSVKKEKGHPTLR